MAINFPINPTLNQVYTFDNRSWKWNGEYWQSITVTVGYTGSRGQGSIFKNSVPTEQDLPVPYSGDEGDGFLVESTGFMWIWDGSSWGSLGQFTGFTGSRGSGIIDTEIVNDELIITYEDSTQNNVGNVRGFVGSKGESSFTWGPTPPPNPVVGDRWFDTIEGGLAVYTDDGNSLQWVEVSASGFVGQTGYTGSEGSVGRSIAMTIVFGGG